MNFWQNANRVPKSNSLRYKCLPSQHSIPGVLNAVDCAILSQAPRARQSRLRASGVTETPGKRLVHGWRMSIHMTNTFVFILAAFLEIAGCFAFWAWLRRGASPLIALIGVASQRSTTLVIARELVVQDHAVYAPALVAQTVLGVDVR